jgi:hypothetical protein
MQNIIFRRAEDEVDRICAKACEIALVIQTFAAQTA